MLWTISFVEFHEYVSVAHEFIEIEGLDSTDESSDEEPVSHKKASRVKFSRAPIKVPVKSTDSQRSLLRQKKDWLKRSFLVENCVKVSNFSIQYWGYKLVLKEREMRSIARF